MHHVEQERRKRAVEFVAHGVVVDRHHVVDLGTDAPGLHLVLLEHVVELEREVVRGERRAVRPLHALPQEQSEAHVVGGERVALGHVGANLPAEAHAQQRRAAARLLGQVVPGRVVGGEHEERAAVVAYLGHLQQHRLDRQPLVDRRQLAARHHGGQHRRFVVGAARHRGRGGRVAAAIFLAGGPCRTSNQHRRRHQRRQEQSFLHDVSPCRNSKKRPAGAHARNRRLP